MPKTDFNALEFAQNIAQQAVNAIPPEIDDQYKQFLGRIIFNFAKMAGETLANEENSLLTIDNIQIIVQYIAEWSFHKGIELIHSDIPPEHWEKILQTIAGGVFEAGKRSFIGGLDEETIRTIVEGEVASHYTHALNLLKGDGSINDEQIYSVQAAKEKAKEQIQLQIPQEVKEEKEEEVQQINPKVAKLATVAVIITSLPEEKRAAILNSFKPEEAQIIQYYMQPDHMNMQIDPEMTAQLLHSLKRSIMPEEAPTVVAKHIQQVAKSVDPAKIIAILIKERPIVQTYVKSCIEGKFIRRDFSPYLGKTICKYIEKQLYPA